MLNSIRRFLNKHHRGLILIVLLSLTAQMCEGCGDYQDLPDVPPRTEGTEITFSLNVEPTTTVIGEQAVLTYSVALGSIPNRMTTFANVLLTLPEGVEFVQPIQPVFLDSFPYCTLDRNPITDFLVRSSTVLELTNRATPCSFSVNIKATRPGIFTLESRILLSESQQGFDSVTQYYFAQEVFTITGGIIASKQFRPTEVKQGETSQMFITLTNDTPIRVTGITFRDPMPAGMTLLEVTNNSCTGSRITTRNNQITFEGGVLDAYTSCGIVASVRGDGEGLLTNITSFVSAVEFDYSNQGQASLNVLAPTSTPLPPPPPPPVEPPASVCGNLVCEPGETLASCVRDCG